MDIGLQHFIYNRTTLNHILLDRQDIGAHTDVIEFNPGKVQTYKWTHLGARPMGVGITHQCFSCGRLKTIKPRISSDGSSVVHKCSICHDIQTYNLPAGWKWLHNDKEDRRGAWLVRTDYSVNNDVMDTA
jgi:hypothetical protein